MNYFTTITYEMKRKSVNFSKKMSNGLSLPKQKFIGNMLYGLNAAKDIKITSIARELHEEIKLDNTVERLCLNLERLNEQDRKIIINNYYKEVINMIPDEPIVIIDESDIVKEYGKKFEDLDIVKDGSAIKDTYKPGYHVCNATVLTKNEKQPLPIYSKIYSCKSDDFISANKETYKCIDECRNALKRTCTYVFDRGYDDKKTFDYVLKGGDNIIARLKENRTFLFKGKKKKLHDVYESRKGKIKMNIMFQEEEKEVYISHTRAVLPADKREYTIIFVYGLSENEKMIILTNKKIKDKEDLIKIVRIYLYRWRIETYHRSIKDEYNYEDMRVRTLTSINNLNLLFMIEIGFVIKLIEEMDTNLLSIKIIYESQSLRKKVGVWVTQFARGIRKILSRARSGIKEYFKSNRKSGNYQLSLNL